MVEEEDVVEDPGMFLVVVEDVVLEEIVLEEMVLEEMFMFNSLPLVPAILPSYGEVWLSVNKKTNRKNAIKCLTRESRKFTESQKKRLVDKLNKELDLLRMLDHPGVLEANICKRNLIYLMLELMSGGDLREFLIDGRQLEESTAKYFFLQMITDFGLSKLVNDDTICKTYCGTPLYLAPEVVLSVLRRSYTEAVDVWSIGVMLFLMLSGYHPFDQSNQSSSDSLSTSDYIARVGLPDCTCDSQEAQWAAAIELIRETSRCFVEARDTKACWDLLAKLFELPFFELLKLTAPYTLQVRPGREASVAKARHTQDLLEEAQQELRKCEETLKAHSELVDAHKKAAKLAAKRKFLIY
ncbi:hypothetical protein DAPPUDRAFT_333155 [Daphnia pulex]|uniref:Protein kinase domain-containing protein n=1 Tax=Daphnia pulex TaxID=6669 RepID=E9HS16_DAPPU|nr:hypothetical protein DAPPUDRAFT_333155 [Daphnia pulex]|eukprot:EFX65486.1 hypothetical protein DAPPUDRAFT_333155 [Daphnia pulex]